MQAFVKNSAAAVVRGGGVIAYPTEAVWGLGCNPFDEQAVLRILALKQRPVDKGLIVLASSISSLSPVLSTLPQSQIDHLNRGWPASTSYVIDDYSGFFPEFVRGQFNSIAVRISVHKPLNDLVESCGGLLISTSANPAGLDPAITETQAVNYFGDQVDCYASGSLGSSSSPSQIIRLSDLALLRP